MKITFYGAANCVTGSCYLLETGDTKFLVDCGMFQGPKELRELNYEDFKFNPNEIDFVLLTHAHIDHSGMIPKLYKHGYTGDILATPPTVELCEVMLPDSGHIQETEVMRKNKKYKRRGQPLIEPVYTIADAHNCLKYFKRVDYDHKIELKDNIKICFRNAGHILGSAIIEIFFTENDKTFKLTFTGDLGNKNQPIVKDPYILEETDYLILESTYGNRVHGIRDRKSKRDKLKEVILKTLERGGNLIVPAFAVERTQDFLVDLNILLSNNEIPDFPIYIDSPLAIAATEIFQRNHQYFDEATSELNKDGEKAIVFDSLKFSKTVDDSKHINTIKSGIMVISASGMCDAGRIKHHLKYNLWEEKNSILFIGYQAEGTLGRRLVDGEKMVRIHGESVMVNAEIIKLEGFSGHIDNPGLLEWLSNLKQKPTKIFIVHGEEEQQKGLVSSINENLKFSTYIPELFETVELVEDQKIEVIEKKTRVIDFKNKYFEKYRTAKQNLKELMKLRLNRNETEELYEDLNTIEKITRRYLILDDKKKQE